ncbi:MAG: S26 family signal peptidase [Clostridia bacterium]|nr:S26 family signal peptidase [Clostridia bacterium]
MEQTAQKKKVTVGSVISVVLDVLLYVFLALAIVVVALTVMSKIAQKDDPTGAPNLFGYEMRYVETGSMEPAYPVNTMVFIEKAPTSYKASIKWFENVKEGDVLTFYYREAGQRVVITHRVVDKKPNTELTDVGGVLKEKGGYIITLEGDNKGDDETVAQQYIYTYAHYNEMAEANDQLQGQVIGKVVGQNLVLGVIVTTLKNPLGMVLIIIVPCLIVIILEVIRIVKVFNAEKNEKAKRNQEAQQEKLDQQNSEIELLKQQLALLQQQAGLATAPPQSQTVTAPPQSEPVKTEETVTPTQSGDEGKSE